LPSKRKKSNVPARDPGLDNDALDLYNAVSELVRAYQFRDRKSICYYDVSVTQCYALGSIITHGPMTLNGLAAELYLDKSTASRVVGALVQKGYVRRSVDPADARALNLEATRKGLDLHSKISEDLIEEMRTLVVDCDPGTRQALARLITLLASAASDRFGSKGGGCTGKV